MARHWLALLVTFALALVTFVAHAEPEAPKAKAPARKGVAVLATEGATDAAWSLAVAVYGDADLRPSLDERGARVLAGEAVEGTAPTDLKELAELRAGVKGDDAASRQLLATIADKLGVSALIVVHVEGTGRTTARTFVTESKSFEAAVFIGERGEENIAWPGVVAALHKEFAPPPPPPTPLVPEKKKEEKGSGKPFYLSPWFWGAVGAAVLGGLAIFLATRESESDAIRLQVRLPQ